MTFDLLHRFTHRLLELRTLWHELWTVKRRLKGCKYSINVKSPTKHPKNLRAFLNLGLGGLLIASLNLALVSEHKLKPVPALSQLIDNKFSVYPLSVSVVIEDFEPKRLSWKWSQSYLKPAEVGKSKKHFKGRGCSTVVERMLLDQEAVGLNPDGCWWLFGVLPNIFTLLLKG